MDDTFFLLAEKYRLGIFITVLTLMAVLELVLPKRQVNANRKLRWTSNLGIVVFDTLLAKILLPTSTIALAIYCEEANFGLFNTLNIHSTVALISCVLLLDFLIYIQHVVFHKVHWLWRFHRMHHSDTHIDVTTGIRFHPVEIILSLLIKFTAIILFGVPAIAILLFEIILNAGAMITHSNLSLPGKIDHALRYLFVTPDMHRIHHSVHKHETDSNYGFNLSIWDRAFRTYTQQPVDSHKKMLIGLHIFRDSKEQRLDKLLTQPFRTSNNS